MAGSALQRRRADDRFWRWREIIYRFLHRMMPDDLRAISAQADVEMLEGASPGSASSIISTTPDGGPYDDQAEPSARIVATWQQSGVRLTLLPRFYAHDGFGGVRLPPRALVSIDARMPEPLVWPQLFIPSPARHHGSA